MTTEHRPLTDLIGLDPNFTGGLSPEEHLRRQRCGECDDALKDRDAAREELAKTRAELARAQQLEAMAGRHAQQRDADLKDAEVTIQRLKTRLAEGDARWSRHMADEHPIEAEADPATMAEPADEPKATCHLPVQNGEPCGLLTCRKHGCRVAPHAEPDEPKATCGATGPDLPFIACTYPAGHPPIPIDVRGVGMRHMDHGNDREYRTWWNGRTALVHGDALAQQNRMVSAENAAIVLDDAEPAAS